MTDFFLKLLNMSISASWLILAVLLLRLLLKRAPKWISVLLWGVVALRLIWPFSIESALSLIPSAETISPEILLDTTPAIHSGIPALNSVINPIISGSNTPAPGDSVNPLQIAFALYAAAWVAGMLLMALYTGISYYRIHRRVSTAVRLRENIFQSEHIASPFVLGVLRPKIYLPLHLEDWEREHVVAHEQAHISRRDHWWKPLGFLLLTLHWFNPLVWLAYVLLCRDIELACDEKVVRALAREERADYSQALLSCAVGHKMIAACPLAFGEVGVKARVTSVLNYKKPAFWLIGMAVLACIVVALCFLTDPMDAIRNPAVQEYVPGAPGILGSVDKARFESVSADFAIGADQYGRAVFKDPYQAFDTMTALYAEGIALIREENGLAPISYGNYELYKKFGWQTTSGSEEAISQAAFVSRFLDIYENSFAEETPQPGQEMPTKEPMELVPGTSYVSYQCLYMNPLSSFAAIGGDSGCLYTVGEDYFETVYRGYGTIDLTGVTIWESETENRTYESNNLIDVPKWEWQSFPYTDEEWAALYWPEIWSIPNISELYSEILYQPLVAGKFLLRVDGDLWLAELSGTHLWSIYSLVPQAAMGSVQWEYTALALSSRQYTQIFPFAFDMDYTEVIAFCAETQLVDYDSEDKAAEHSLTLQEGNALYWSPLDEAGSLVTDAVIRFTIRCSDGESYSGSLYLTAAGEEQAYTASLVGTGLYLAENEAGEGGVIRKRS